MLFFITQLFVYLFQVLAISESFSLREQSNYKIKHITLCAHFLARTSLKFTSISLLNAKLLLRNFTSFNFTHVLFADTMWFVRIWRVFLLQTKRLETRINWAWIHALMIAFYYSWVKFNLVLCQMWTYLLLIWLSLDEVLGV